LSLLAFLLLPMHELDITYHNTYNCKTLRIEDNSIYDDKFEVKNSILEIKAPGQNCFTFFDLKKDWKSITLNCASLKLCCTKQPCKLTILPDGIYEIKFSIDPNIKYMVEFNHMRVCKLMSNYIKLIGLYLSNKTSNTNKENEEIEKEFTAIKDIIDASVYAVEELLDNSLGIDLYEQASKRINDINNGNFTGCCK